MFYGKIKDTLFLKMNNLGLNVKLDYFLLKGKKENSKTNKTRDVIKT